MSQPLPFFRCSRRRLSAATNLPKFHYLYFGVASWKRSRFFHTTCGYIAVTAITGLVLGAVITERSEAGEASDTKDKLLSALQRAQASLQEAHALGSAGSRALKGE